jgi:outer membrane protein TolC
VFTASISLNGARTQVVDALASYQNSRIALARAAGGARDLQ